MSLRRRRDDSRPRALASANARIRPTRASRASRVPRAATATRARRDPAPRDAGPSPRATFAASFAASVVALHGANPVALADAETASEPASVSSASTVSIASFVDVDAAPAPSVTSSTPSSRRSSSSDRLPSDPTSTPSEPGEVILDYGRVFAPERADALRATIADLEARTGWRVRVVTGYGPTSTSMPAPNDLYRYWRADRKTVILAADAFNGNVLEFYDDSAGAQERHTEERVPGDPRAVRQQIFRGRGGSGGGDDARGGDGSGLPQSRGMRLRPGSVDATARVFARGGDERGFFVRGRRPGEASARGRGCSRPYGCRGCSCSGFIRCTCDSPTISRRSGKTRSCSSCVAATRAGVGVFGSEESERPTPARSETESGGGDGPR